jgi:predicted unusual protein kinase regulating ubiquinone biosynthesis (AarF/ABC1/UbiB family)
MARNAATSQKAAGQARPAEQTSGDQPVFDRRRYYRAVWFFARVFVSFIWWDLVLRRLPVIGDISRRSALDRWRNTARRFRRLALEMGGVMIKLGQFLSIRVDVLPTEITRELAGLQDEVPAERLADILGVIEREFGRPATQVYAWFSPEPEAAASLAQVHRARLQNNQDVVVKVQRPRIGSLVETDLAAVRQAIRWLKWYRTISRRVDLDRLYAEFASTTRAELDFVAEGKNTEHFEADFADNPGIYVAHVYWDYTTRCVLTLENVASLKITDYAAIEAAGVSRAEVARRVYDAYLTQIFVNNFVHADPHPGNLFVRPLTELEPDGAQPGETRTAGADAGVRSAANPSTPAAAAAGQAANRQAGEATQPGDGRTGAATDLRRGRPFQLIFIDFGMVAVIPERMRAALREFIIGLGLQDGHRIVQAYVDAGILLPGADLKTLEEMHDVLFRGLAGVRMGQLAGVAMAQAESMMRQYRALIYEMPVQFPTDIVFVGRAVAILSGLATSLDPDFDPWAATIPFAEKVAASENAFDLRGGLSEIGNLARLALQLPERMDRVVRMAEHGQLSTQMMLAPDTARALRRLERGVDRLAWMLVAVGLLLGGVILRTREGPGGLSDWLLVGAGLSFVWGLTRR